MGFRQSPTFVCLKFSQVNTLVYTLQVLSEITSIPNSDSEIKSRVFLDKCRESLSLSKLLSFDLNYLLPRLNPTVNVYYYLLPKKKKPRFKVPIFTF